MGKEEAATLSQNGRFWNFVTLLFISGVVSGEQTGCCSSRGKSARKMVRNFEETGARPADRMALQQVPSLQGAIVPVASTSLPTDNTTHAHISCTYPGDPCQSRALVQGWFASSHETKLLLLILWFDHIPSSLYVPTFSLT